jgi:hypothetical protein
VLRRHRGPGPGIYERGKCKYGEGHFVSG